MNVKFGQRPDCQLCSPPVWAILVAAVLSQSADPLAEAQRAFDDLQFERALALVPQPEAWPAFSRSQVVRALALRALALASVKRDAEAGLALRQLLAVDSEWQLPEQFGPRVRTLVLEAKDAAERAGTLSIAFEAGSFSVKGDAAGLAQRLVISWTGASPGSIEHPITTTVPAPWPPSSPVEVTAVVLGPGRSTLAQWGPRSFGAASVASSSRVETAPRARGPLFIPGLVAGIAGALTVGGGVAAVVVAGQPAATLANATRDADGRITSLSQRRAFELDAAANTAWQVGGGLIIGGAVALAAGATLVVLDVVQVGAGPGGVSLAVPLGPDFGVAAGVEP